MISWQAPEAGRLSPATDMEMPVSTSPSASTVRNSSSPQPPGWRSTASPAWRAMAAARPSICSPVTRWDSSQSATAEMLEITSPTPERMKRIGASRMTSRSMTIAIGFGTPYEPRPASLSSVATGEHSPSWLRFVATATSGRPTRAAANLAQSMILPPPMPTTAS